MFFWWWYTMGEHQGKQVVGVVSCCLIPYSNSPSLDKAHFPAKPKVQILSCSQGAHTTQCTKKESMLYATFRASQYWGHQVIGQSPLWIWAFFCFKTRRKVEGSESLLLSKKLGIHIINTLKAFSSYIIFLLNTENSQSMFRKTRN